MDMKQIAPMLNNQILPEVLGESVTVKEDLSNIVDVGTALANVNAVDPFSKKLVNVIGKMVFLEELALVNQPLSSVNRLNGLMMLQELYLSGDRSLTSLASLTDLPQLERLHLEHSGIRDLSPLAQVPSLKTVTVSADMLPLTLPESGSFTVLLVP